MVAQPDQTIDVICNRGADCLTPVKASFGGALSGSFRDPGVWGIAATLGLVHAVDQEERPLSGYSVLTLRLDLELELGRTARRFGAALRVSPSFAFGWHRDDSAFRAEIPGLTLMLGRTDLWGEVAVPHLPTPADPRIFHLGVGWTHPRISGVAGFGTFGTLGFKPDTLDRAGSRLGAFAHLDTPLTDRFRLTLRLAISSPFIIALGFRASLGGPI